MFRFLVKMYVACIKYMYQIEKWRKMKQERAEAGKAARGVAIFRKVVGDNLP